MGDDADSHELLSVVAAVHHERVGETLDDRALCLPEALCGITASGVGDVDWGTDLDVIAVELYVSHCSGPKLALSYCDCAAVQHSNQVAEKGFLRQRDIADLNLIVSL